jgi:hypothetical protein
VPQVGNAGEDAERLAGVANVGGAILAIIGKVLIQTFAQMADFDWDDVVDAGTVVRPAAQNAATDGSRRRWNAQATTGGGPLDQLRAGIQTGRNPSASQ